MSKCSGYIVSLRFLCICGLRAVQILICCRLSICRGFATQLVVSVQHVV